MSNWIRAEIKDSCGLLWLNRQEKINSLDVTMVEAIKVQLDQWSNNSEVKAILLLGEGERGFCAGGDVVSITCEQGTLKGSPWKFFEKEYCADLAIHQYQKPIICLAHGVTMGGGIGLMVGAKYRVAFSSTLLAMPEVSIGLFPDVGATYFLSKMKKPFGLWMALTGARVNGFDGLDLGIIDYVVQLTPEEIRERICSLVKTSSNLDQDLSELLDRVSIGGEGEILKNKEEIEKLIMGESLEELHDSFCSYKGDNSWVTQCLRTYQDGSPFSRYVAFEQLRQGEGFTLEGAFQLEEKLGYYALKYGDFEEGVRALLIDKDNKPKWKDFLNLNKSEIKKIFDQEIMGENKL